MKTKTLAIILFTFLVTSMFAQKGNAVIHFKDGKVLKGITTIRLDGRIKYKANKKAKKQLYHFKAIDRIRMSQAGEVSYYVYLKNKSTGSFKVLKEVAVGKVNLYKIVTQGYSGGMPMGNGFGGGMHMTMGHSYSYSNFYVKKENENDVTHLGSTAWLSKNFKKAASNYFRDCPVLAKKIQDKVFKKKDVREIIDFYNQECN